MDIKSILVVLEEDLPEKLEQIIVGVEKPVTKVNERGQTLLHLAASHGATACANFLI
jgi:hypothetical protein